MLRIFTSAILAMAGCAASSAIADTGSQTASAHLSEKLRGVSSVSFYFVSRTGDYSLDRNKIKSDASIKIYRKCGGNCAGFMKAVINHLKQSTSSKCLSGQQNALIEIGKETYILYGHSGRTIEFEDKCYYNDAGVDSIVKNSDFLFN